MEHTLFRFTVLSPLAARGLRLKAQAAKGPATGLARRGLRKWWWFRKPRRFWKVALLS